MTPLPGVPLSHLLDEVGSTLLTVAGGPARDPVVTGVAIHDPTDPAGAAVHPPGALVLGVGVADAREATALLPALEHAGAAGLVLRAHVPDGSARAALDDAVAGSGVPVLVAAAVPWSQLVQLLRAVIDPVRAGSRPVGRPLGDLFALSNTVAAALGGAVTIEDRASRVLAFSGNQAVADAARVATVLGRQVPAEWRDRLAEAGVFDRLYSSTEPIDVVLPVPGLHPRAAVAVRAGEEILGSIWATTDGPLDADRSRTLVSAARTAALHILEERAVESAGRRRRAELTARLLDGEPAGPAAATAQDTARCLGLPDGPFVVAAGRLDNGPDLAADRQAGLQRAADALGMHLATVSPGTVTTVLDDTAYAVLPLPPGTSRVPVPVRRTLQRLADRRDPSIAVGVSRPVARPDRLPVARADADAVLAVLREHGRVADVTDVWAQVVLAQVPLPARLRDYFRTGPLAEVARYDAEHRTPLLESLRTYLESFGDVVGAATRLHVHPNTLRYRLRRVRELTGLDLDDPDARLAVGLQLRLTTASADHPPDPLEE